MIFTTIELGVPTSVQSKLNIHSLRQSSNTNAGGGNFSTPMMNLSDRKRKDTTKALDAPSVAKKSRGRSSSKKIPVQGIVISKHVHLIT